MHLSKIGKWAEACWHEIPSHFPFTILHNHIIMPDHMHGIIEIAKSPRADPPAFSKNKFGPQSKNLASIIRGYKIGVTKNARRINPAFKWHVRFYDIIIRDERAFQAIQKYILNNPKKWKRKQ